MYKTRQKGPFIVWKRPWGVIVQRHDLWNYPEDKVADLRCEHPCWLDKGPPCCWRHSVPSFAEDGKKIMACRKSFSAGLNPASAAIGRAMRRAGCTWFQWVENPPPWCRAPAHFKLLFRHGVPMISFLLLKADNLNNSAILWMLQNEGLSENCFFSIPWAFSPLLKLLQENLGIFRICCGFW